MQANNSFVQLANKDLSAALISSTDVEADFFLRGFDEVIETSELLPATGNETVGERWRMVRR